MAAVDLHTLPDVQDLNLPYPKGVEALLESLHQRATLVTKAEEIDHSDLSDGANVVELFNIPANTLIVDVIVQIPETWNGTTPSATIGDGDDADRFLDSSTLDVTTAGFYSMKQDAQPGSGGHEYSAADTLDATVTITAGDNTQGKLQAWVVYVQDSDEL